MDINNELYRPINQGQSFDKYFEKASCKPTFEKKGNTTDAIKLMRKHALKYKHQTVKIAPTLKGNTLEETVNNIYSFLYDNIQYNVDDYDQNLRSPACSWATRQTGIDCKSYSIFASTILLNLGIPHSFRKVKQKHYEPTHWTHVYTVIKSKGKEIVIDPTIHSNNQVEYLQKKDLKVSNLPYYSLNAGAVATAPAQANAKDTLMLGRFYNVITALEKIGVSQSILDRVEQKVKDAYFKNNNFYFAFKVENNTTLNIAGEKINLFPNGLNGGLSDLDLGHSDWNLDFGNNNDNPPFNLNDFIAGFGNNGNFTGNSVATGLDLETGGLASLISNALGFDIADAVENILAGHWDCIGGTTFDKARVETELAKFQQWYNAMTQQIANSKSPQQLQQLINALSSTAEIFRAAFDKVRKNKNWNSCSDEGLGNLVKFGADAVSNAKALISEINKSNQISVAKVSQGTTITPSNTDPIWTTIGASYQGKLVGHDLGGNYNISYPIYAINVKQQTQTNIDGTPKETTTKTPLVLGGLAIASLLIVPKIMTT